MNPRLLIATVTLAALAISPPATASKWKITPEINYTIYVQGDSAGASRSKVTETADGYVFETHTVVKNVDFDLEIDTRTVADKTTYLISKFSYKGVRNGLPFEGEATFNDNEMSGHVVENGVKYPTTRTSEFPRVLVMEDYVMSHEVLMALAFWAQDEDPVEYGLLFPSTLNMTTIAISQGSELSFESETKEAYCLKYVLAIDGSNPFASYFDPERGLPVYLAFPSSATEIFLDEFFDGKPVSRFRRR
jgi:hypothetical protein